MVKARITNEEGQKILVIGLSRANWEHLLQKQPIAFPAAELIPELTDTFILVLGGETEDEITEELGKHFELPKGNQ